MWRISLVGFVLACAMAAAPVPGPQLALGEVAIAGPIVFAAGDSVRYVIRFTPPDVDSVTMQWSFNQQLATHARRRPWNGAVVDTAKFLNVALSPGGSQATGTVVIKTWQLGVGSAGITKTFDSKRGPPAAPPDIGSFAWVDSAVAYP